ncbi:MAG: glycosyltransferase family 39 protein [Clostridium sp.]|nr:glycosyltransferase family 39 protein [Clostridium sp.]
MKKQNILYGIFEAFFLTALCLIVVISLMEVQYHIAWYKEAFVMAVWLVCLAVMGFVLKKLEKWMEKHEKILFPAFCFLWGILLYAFSCFIRNTPSQDYDAVYTAAANYAAGEEVEWWYFATWKNNYFLFLILGNFMKFGNLLGLRDPFYLILLFSAGMAVWGGICIYLLLADTNQSVMLRWTGLLLFVGFIPLWGGTQNFYTDTMSICFGIWACLLVERALRKKGSGRNYLYAGLLWGVGYAIKATTAISMLAVLLILLTAMKWKEWLRIFLAVVIGFLIVSGGVECLWQLSPGHKMEDELAAPLEYWLALGSAGDGSYLDNSEFADACIGTVGKEAKRELARTYIKEQELFSPGHWKRKIRYNFATGLFGLIDFHDDPAGRGYDFFNDWGTYGGYVAMLTTGYFFAILVLGAVSCCLVLRGIKRGQAPHMTELTAQLTIFGLILFLMMWEANNRQLYNHMPWLAMIGAFGLAGVFGRKE